MISVIIPAYNSAATLGRAIESVLQQRDAGIEIVVTDDGSTDSTVAVARGYGDPVRVFSQPRGGPAVARNLALSKSGGEFVAFLDADDEWLPGRISKCIAPMLENEAVGLTWCRAILKRVNGSEEIRNIRSPSRNRQHRLLWPDPLQCTPATTCRRAVLDQVGYFDESLSSREDKDLWIRVSEVSEVVEIPEALVVVHEQADGCVRSNQLALERIRGDYLSIIHKALARNPEQYRRHADAILGEAYRYWGQYALFHGFKQEARADLVRAMKHRPGLLAGCYAVLSVLPDVVVDALRRVYRARG